MTTALELTAPPATDTAVADLVLVRMSLPSKRPVAPKAVRRDIGKLLGCELSAADFDDLRNDLASAGFLTKGKRNTFTLTDAGRERALQFLGVTDLPPRANWSTVIAKYLFPRAAGLSADAAAELNNADKLAAFVLKRKYGLASGAGSTVSQVLEAVVCKQLEFSSETTLDGLLSAVLSRLLGSERLTKVDLAKQLPLFETGLKAASPDAVRCKVVNDWLSGARAKGRGRRSPSHPTPSRRTPSRNTSIRRTPSHSTCRRLPRLFRRWPRRVRPRIGSTITRSSLRRYGGRPKRSRASRASRCLNSRSGSSRQTRKISST